MRAWQVLAAIGIAVVLVLMFLPRRAQTPRVANGGGGGENAALTIYKEGSISLSDYQGKVVLLDFWATWCPPCRAALPHTQELSESADVKNGKLVVLAINVGEPEKTVRDFLRENGYTLPVLLDTSNTLSGKFNVEGIPNFVILDETGKQVYQQAGMDEHGLTAALKKALQD